MNMLAMMANEPNVKDEELLAELNTMKEQGDEDAITDAFFQDLAFGTAGLRGTIGAGTNRMNIYTVARATQGFADYLNATFEHPTVAIARDSRNKGELFVKTTAAILAANGVTALVYPKISPVPTLSWAVRDLKCSGGICKKYLSVPATTNFGIMFVPFEGLYAEVVSRPGLIETLGRDYHVNVAGPSTMAAILNSLQMSYQTFRLQKRTDDVLRVLSAVKAELPRYQAALRRAQQQIETAGKTVEGIITTRTNVMERKLKDIDALEDAREADEILGLTSAELLADQKDED